MGKSFFRYDIRCSIFNGGMLLSIILSLLILLQSLSSAHIFSTDSNMDYLSITLIPLATSGYVPFACFFAVFPYAFSFLEEYNSGYIKYILLRMDRKRYLRQKIIAVSISGGVAMVIPFFFIFFLLQGQFFSLFIVHFLSFLCFCINDFGGSAS